MIATKSIEIKKANLQKRKIKQQLSPKTGLGPKILIFLLSLKIQKFPTNQTFLQLKLQMLIKTPIFWHFYLKCQIYIEINISSYTIGKVFSQVVFNNLGWQSCIAFFSQIIVPTETYIRFLIILLWLLLKLCKYWEILLIISSPRFLYSWTLTIGIALQI